MQFAATLSLMTVNPLFPESITETCNVVLTFETQDEILGCDHSNEKSLVVLVHGTICFPVFKKMKNYDFSMNFDLWHSWELKD